MAERFSETSITSRSTKERHSPENRTLCNLKTCTARSASRKAMTQHSVGDSSGKHFVPLQFSRLTRNNTADIRTS